MNLLTTPRIRRAAIRLLPCVIALFSVGCTQDRPPATFASPDEAVSALVGALRPPLNRDKLDEILGSDGKEITSSGDEVADRANAEEFVQNFDKHHHLEARTDGGMDLIVGDHDWPMPIPIAKDEQGWFFDTAEGKDEVLRRRIGHNENATMQVILAIVDAQREYALLDPDNNGLHEYATKFFSTPGKHDGLYWQTPSTARPSPLGELVADASEEGYASGASDTRRPYHGYFYRIIFEQGRGANGGELEYMAGGKLLNGFAVVAWPATYRNSGVMTFITNHEGVVYEKDLGDGTDSAAKSMRKFDPEGWTRSQVPAPK